MNLGNCSINDTSPITVKQEYHVLWKPPTKQMSVKTNRTFVCVEHDLRTKKSYAERSTIPQHVDKGKMNKCILKASMNYMLLDTRMCWTYYSLDICLLSSPIKT